MPEWMKAELDAIMMAFVRIGRDMSVPIDVRNFATEQRDKVAEIIAKHAASAVETEKPALRQALRAIEATFDVEPDAWQEQLRYGINRLRDAAGWSSPVSEKPTRCPTCHTDVRDCPNCMIVVRQKRQHIDKFWVHDGPCELCTDPWHSSEPVGAQRDKEAERKAFEAWAQKNAGLLPLYRTSDGEYSWIHAKYAWGAWQAARSLAPQPQTEKETQK